MTKWIKTTFTDAVEINPHVDLISGDFYPFVNMNTIEAKIRYVHAIENKKFTGGGSRFIPYDTLMARITPCLENGKIARYIPDDKGKSTKAFGSTEFIVLRGKNDVTDNDFVYYLTKWNKFHNFAITQMTGSSGRQRVPIKSLSNFSFLLPPIPIQKHIAYILGTLDDKIELNHQMNQTLENMARAIFKSWFVDFDPVYAKMERRDYPLPSDIMDLFPDELVESELGFIPMGWKVEKLGNEFDILMGQSPPSNTYNEEGIGLPFYQGRKDFGFRFPSLRVFCNTPTRIANVNDTLVSVRAPIGDINMAFSKCCIGRGIAKIIHVSNSPSYTYYSMLRLKDHFNQYEADGTVFGSLSKDSFKSIINIKPPEKIISIFENYISCLDKKIKNNYIQIGALDKIRNVLLPHLINGLIDV